MQDDTRHYIYLIAVPLKYEFDSDFLEAKVGDSPTVHFTLKSDLPLPEDIKHVLTTKDGKGIPERFKIEGNDITFHKVRVTDSGIYNIHCYQNGKSLVEDNLELDIAPNVSVRSSSTYKAIVISLPCFILYMLNTAPSKYVLDSYYLEAKVGESPTIKFSLEPKPPSAEPVKHSLIKDGTSTISKRFEVKDGVIMFRKVKVKDSGTYTLSCRHNDELLAEEILELEISPSPPPKNGEWQF